jgi:hypothetical protein
MSSDKALPRISLKKLKNFKVQFSCPEFKIISNGDGGEKDI